MAQFCVLVPQVKNKQGEIIDSKLYTDLLSLTSNNRALTNQAYYTIIGDDFQQKWRRKLSFDDSFEPTLESVTRNTDLLKVLPKVDVVNSITKQLDIVDTKGNTKMYEDTYENYHELSSKVATFNTNSLYNNEYSVVIRTKDNKIYLSVEKATEANKELAKNIASNYYLNDKIRSILISNGFTIGGLNNLDKKLGINGVTDFSKARTESEGLIEIIRIANGRKGEQALPEEFAHFIVETLSDNDMIQRLTNTISSNEKLIQYFLGDEYDQYAEMYDRNTLIKEAVGKAVYSQFLKGEMSPSGFTNLFSRVNKSISTKFSELNEQDILEAIKDAEEMAGKIAMDVMTKNLAEDLRIDKIKSDATLYQIEHKAKSDREILNQIIDNECKQYKIYTDKLKIKSLDEAEAESIKKWQEKHTEIINALIDKLNNHSYIDGIYSFLETASSDLRIVNDKLNDCQVSSTLPLNVKATKLRYAKGYIDNYTGIVQELIDAVNQDINEEDKKFGDDLRKLLGDLSKELASSRSNLNARGVEIFANFLAEFFPENDIEIEVGARKGTVIRKEDLAELLTTATEDTSFLNTWVESASESTDIAIQLADKAIKEAKFKVNTRTKEYQLKLLAADTALKKAGIKNNEWMFEKGSDGTLSKNYLSPINYTKYKEDETEFFAYLDGKYGKIAKGLDANQKIIERNAWLDAHLDEFGLPREYAKDGTPLYHNPEYDALNGLKKEYYDTFMSIREELLSYLPESTINPRNPYLAVQITKDFRERLKANGFNISGMMQELRKSAQDAIYTRVDSTEFGIKAAIRDFANREIMSIPIFFTKELSNVNNLSRDTTSTLLAFSQVAVNYDEMSKISDILEVGRDVMENRISEVSSGDKPVVEVLKQFGRTVSKQITKSTNNNFVTGYSELLDTQVYNRFLKDDGFDVGDKHFTWNKAVSNLNTLSSLNQLAINLLAGVAAVTNDIFNVNSEVVAGMFGEGIKNSAKHLWDADKIYRKNILGIMGEIHNPIKTNKLNLFIEKFNLLHEYEDDIKDMRVDQSRFAKFASTNSLYFLMHAGSHWGETRTALAQALNIQITSDDGKTTKSLWDVLQVEYVDENNPSAGARLVVEDSFTISESDLSKYRNQFNGLNRRLFGNYDKTDRTAFQKTAIGNLVLLYRRYLISGINRRFGASKYSSDLNTTVEGYYRSMGRFFKAILTDSQNFNRNVRMYWDSMKPIEKQNCLRAINELGTWCGLLAVVMLTEGADWDKKDNPWHKRFIAYMSKRSKAEIGALTPLGVFGETLTILKSPAASLNTLENFSNLTSVLNPSNYPFIVGEDAIVKSGRYKGKSKVYRDIMNSPFVPMNKTVYKALHPEEAMAIFK